MKISMFSYVNGSKLSWCKLEWLKPLRCNLGGRKTPFRCKSQYFLTKEGSKPSRCKSHFFLASKDQNPRGAKSIFPFLTSWDQNPRGAKSIFPNLGGIKTFEAQNSMFFCTQEFDPSCPLINPALRSIYCHLINLALRSIYLIEIGFQPDLFSWNRLSTRKHLNTCINRIRPYIYIYIYI